MQIQRGVWGDSSPHPPSPPNTSIVAYAHSTRLTHPLALGALGTPRNLSGGIHSIKTAWRPRSARLRGSSFFGKSIPDKENRIGKLRGRGSSSPFAIFLIPRGTPGQTLPVVSLRIYGVKPSGQRCVGAMLTVAVESEVKATV